MLDRIIRVTVVALLVSMLGMTGAVAPVSAAARVPKVVLIVGPVGELTTAFRKLADEAAVAATTAGAEVVKVYSPNATWPAVQEAVDGASIVVYLGHGNGWPSRYRDALYPPTQNGFGLNPEAGVDDSAHQYFGEASVEHLRLAPNAVVLLHHLCYAAGSSEPGLPEGRTDDAVQRVDNYAAGFLRAGARAVVAEGHLGPAYYVRALLTANLTIERIWDRSPSANGHTFRVASVRSAGYTEALDPEAKTGGYYRSLVSAGVAAAAIRAGATGSPGMSVVGPPPPPSLVGLGLRFDAPMLRALPIAGTTTRLTVPFAAAGGVRLPPGAQVGVRWDPILLDPKPPAVPSGEPPAPSPTPGETPGPTPDSSPRPTPQPKPAPTPEPGADPPAVDLVVPERAGTVVTLARAKASAHGLDLNVRYPAAPGLYRLVVTLHTPAGVAYDAASQALLVPVTVRVGGPFAVAYGVASARSMEAGSADALVVRVVNAGSEPWNDAAALPAPQPGGEAFRAWFEDSRRPARLVATWLSTTGLAVPAPVIVVLDRSVSSPGGEAVTRMDLIAPAEPGDYLLVLDVVSPSHGPLSALGSQPALVRVSVAVPATPQPRGTPRPPERPE